jgi:hypothetical protein
MKGRITPTWEKKKRKDIKQLKRKKEKKCFKKR